MRHFTSNLRNFILALIEWNRRIQKGIVYRTRSRRQIGRANWIPKVPFRFTFLPMFITSLEIMLRPYCIEKKICVPMVHSFSDTSVLEWNIKGAWSNFEQDTKLLSPTISLTAMYRTFLQTLRHMVCWPVCITTITNGTRPFSISVKHWLWGRRTISSLTYE